MVDNLRFRFALIAVLLALAIGVLAYPITKSESPFTLGLDLRGGVELRYEFPEILDKSKGEADEALAQAVTIFRDRLDASGVKDISVRPVPPNQVEVSIPGITSAEATAYKNVLQSQGSLEFRIVASSERGLDVANLNTALFEEIQRRRDAGIPVTRTSDFSDLTRDIQLSDASVRWMPISEKYEADYREQNGISATTPGPFFMLLRYEADETKSPTGEWIESVGATTDQRGFPAVSFEVKRKDASRFGRFTGSNLNNAMAIVLDGQVQSAPNINGKISQSGQISGGSEGFTQEELRRLIAVIKSGSLKEKPQLYSQHEVGPTLGAVAIERGKWAGGLALGLVIIFMVIYYMKAGTVACAALTANVLLLLGALAGLDATLTLPGIAGLVLTVGMAVDANILIFERIREEHDKGKTIPQAVKTGFEKAFFTIVDANVTTFITAFWLYKLGTPTIRGFAVTLMIGIATSMFCALYFSKSIFAWWVEKDLKSLPMMRLLSTPSYGFLRHRKTALLGSTAAIVLGLFGFLLLDNGKYGMDFTGGCEAQVKFSEPVDAAKVADKVDGLFPTAEVVAIGGGGSNSDQFQIKVKENVADSLLADGADGDESDLSTVFGEKLLGLFADDANFKLAPRPFSGITIGDADDQGRSAFSATLNYLEPVSRNSLADALTPLLGASTEVQTSDEKRFQVSGTFAQRPPSEDVAVTRLTEVLIGLEGKDGDAAQFSNPMPSRSFVGPKAGSELRDAAVQAMAISILCIILYIRVRFREYRYGLAAVAALVHDVLITLGLIALARVILPIEIEINLAVVAAFLTIIGYSLNDTIVIFDRVRENLPRMDGPMSDILDRSINQTLSRTILTTMTTFIVVLILFAFNVGQKNVLEGFAFSLLVGVLVGTYSTIFVASPAVLFLAQRAERKRAEARAA